MGTSALRRERGRAGRRSTIGVLRESACAGCVAWLAWATGTPAVVISGFTHPTNEFATPYRVHNWHTCNSCWNDPAHRFKHDDFTWCLRHQGTARHFECTRLITSSQVVARLSTSLMVRPSNIVVQLLCPSNLTREST